MNDYLLHSLIVDNNAMLHFPLPGADSKMNRVDAQSPVNAATSQHQQQQQQQSQQQPQSQQQTSHQQQFPLPPGYNYYYPTNPTLLPGFSYNPPMFPVNQVRKQPPHSLLKALNL